MSGSALLVDTRFGTLEADAAAQVTFPSGLPGFEHCQQFIVLSSPDLDPVRCLHAVDGPGVSFLAIDPRLVVPGYRCALTPADLGRIGATGEECLLWLALLTVDATGDTFANLRAPLVVNPATMRGIQSLPQRSAYALRHPVRLG